MILGAAGAFALSWVLELFLFVVASPVGAVSLIVHERLADRSDARRAAALARSVPSGIADPADVEHIIAADLAAAAMGDHDIIDSATRVADRTIADPWRRALARERLEAAKHVPSAMPYAGLRLRQVLGRKSLRDAAATSMLVALAIGAATRQSTWLAPVGISFCLLVLASSERRRCERVCELLVRRATMEPALGRVFVHDGVIVAAITELSRERPRVLRLARRFVAASPQDDVAIARLSAVELPSHRMSSLSREIVLCAVLAVAFTAALDAL